MLIKFGEFTLDSGARQLLSGGEPVHLSRKAFDALCVLLERRPDAVTKEELHARLWPGVFVVDANLSVAIAEVRRALGDTAQAPRYIRTVHRIGYAFCAESDAAGEPSVEGDGDPRAFFLLKDRVLRLRAGDNIVGRDPECQVWLDEPGVSRRHARVHVGGEVSIEDLGSKNGTFVNGSPVDAPRPLGDGDRVVIGAVQLDLRMRSTTATETIRIRHGGSSQ